MQSLDEKAWAHFKIPAIFDMIQRGKRLKNADHVSGMTPYVSSTANNNGVDDFIEATPGSRVFNDCISLANSGSVGTAFYEPFEYVASDHVTALKTEGMSHLVYLFLTATIEKQGANFNFNREINDTRIKNMQIMLPVTDSGEPDYGYMAECTQQKREAMLKKYCAYAEECIMKLREPIKIPSLEEKEWAPFLITSLFSSIVPGKGKGLNHLRKVSDGGINYIGATNRNNGVLCYIEENDRSRSMILDGNCIGFIKNGDGSAGFAIYKAEPFVSTSDVLYGYADWLNKFTGLFFVTAQDMIENKYSHGYKRNKDHLASDKVMLPVNASGAPDYEYMEQYAKNLMIQKYQKYLAHIQRNFKE